SPFQHHFYVLHGLPTEVRVLLQTAAHDPLQCGRHPVLSHGRWIARHDRGDHGRGARSLERTTARRHFVDDRSECEDVLAMIAAVPMEALRRDVFGRPMDATL